MFKKYLLVLSVLNLNLALQAAHENFNPADPLGLRSTSFTGSNDLQVRKSNWDIIQERGYFMVGEVRVPLLSPGEYIWSAMQEHKRFKVGQVLVPVLPAKGLMATRWGRK